VEKRANELEREGECERFLVRHNDPVDKFLEIAERRVSLLDDYGDEHWGALVKELVDTRLRKVAQSEGLEDEWLVWQKQRKRGRP